MQFIETLHISKRDFYAIIGVSRGTLEANTGITEDVMAKFIAAYPGISPDWLLTGEGPMLRADGAPTKPNTTESPALDAHLMQIIKEKDLEIKLLNREIGALELKLARLDDKLAPLRSVAQPHVCELPDANDADPDVNQPAKTHKDARDRCAQRDRE